MFITRDNFTVGIVNPKTRKYDLFYNKSVIPSNLEFQSENITKDCKEAAYVCLQEDEYGNSCNVFERNCKDGSTKYYKRCGYTEGNFLELTPEEKDQLLENIKLQDLNESFHRRDRDVHLETASSARDRLQDKMTNKEKFNNTKNDEKIIRLLYILCIVFLSFSLGMAFSKKIYDEKERCGGGVPIGLLID